MAMTSSSMLWWRQISCPQSLTEDIRSLLQHLDGFVAVDQVEICQLEVISLGIGDGEKSATIGT